VSGKKVLIAEAGGKLELMSEREEEIIKALRSFR
jgi:hypothetical protein